MGHLYAVSHTGTQTRSVPFSPVASPSLPSPLSSLFSVCLSPSLLQLVFTRVMGLTRCRAWGEEREGKRGEDEAMVEIRG